MAKVYKEEELRELGMDEVQIAAILKAQGGEQAIGSSVQTINNVVPFTASTSSVSETLRPTALSDIEKYKSGTMVELPPFGEGQPFIARLSRPSMLRLVKTGQIPNSLLNQATALFAKGSNALNGGDKGSASVNDLFDVIEVVVESALLEPTLKDIRSVGMELSDDQLMAIFTYTQQGVKALEKFRTVGANT